jgi:hypothetical protein
MVTGFTVTEVGDVLIARLKEPYTGILRVLGWDIVAGLTTNRTDGITLTFTQGSTTVQASQNFTMNVGERIIVGNQYFTVASVNGAQFDVQEVPAFTSSGLKFYEEPNANSLFVYEYRWSQNDVANGGEMSEFRPLNEGSNSGDLFALNFNSTLPLWLDVRATVDRMASSTVSLSILSVTYELETESGTIEACPQFCGECEDPWAFVGCEGIIVECESNLFNPYELKRPINLYKQITDVSTSIWGHEVRYFRVEPDQRSRDVILMEYSLYNVVEEGIVKIMVPDNEFPSEEFNYDIFGMNFENFEIHITQTEFNKAFGQGPSPKSRDYLYLPFNNRMYEVLSVAYADEFNGVMTYWRVQLKKYEDRTSSIHTDTTVEQAVDDLVVGVEEVFGQEIQEEYEKVTKPQQYKTVFHVVQDGIRSAIHKKLKIADIDLRNRWTVISRNYYDLTTAGEKVEQQDGSYAFEFDEAIIYNLNSSLASDNNLSYVGWFKPVLNTMFATTHQTILDGLDGDKGIMIETSRTEFRVTLNDQVYTYDFGTIDDQNNPFFEATDSMWFSMVINVNNQYNEMSVNIYRLNDDVNEGLPQNAPNRLDLVFNEITTIPAGLSWETNKQYALRGGYMYMTNMRIFTKTIEAEQQVNVLQQYVVRDSHLNILTDNAIPSIMLRKYNQGR